MAKEHIHASLRGLPDLKQPVVQNSGCGTNKKRWNDVLATEWIPFFAQARISMFSAVVKCQLGVIMAEFLDTVQDENSNYIFENNQKYFHINQYPSQVSRMVLL